MTLRTMLNLPAPRDSDEFEAQGGALGESERLVEERCRVVGHTGVEGGFDEGACSTRGEAHVFEAALRLCDCVDRRRARRRAVGAAARVTHDEPGAAVAVDPQPSLVDRAMVCAT